jgi:quercetin dioxygenase-like cupin family protein
MMINRWAANSVPTETQLRTLFEAEGLDYDTEVCEPGQKVIDHRHPHTELRVIAEGELLMSIAGNQVLLRQGDRIEIPANTKHNHMNNSKSNCICVVGHRLV